MAIEVFIIRKSCVVHLCDKYCDINSFIFYKHNLK
uniref:Uncharacterized protein n=1 Tax=Anguilla anguilla TaxID=7936 RepID=A0A0E9UTK4_ANGAN